MNKNLLITALLLIGWSVQVFGTALSSSKLSITENKGQITDQFGQTRSDIQFKVSSAGVNMFISHTGLHYQWNTLEQPQGNNPFSVADLGDMPELSVNSYRMDVELLGANPNPAIIREKQQSGLERYYTTTVDPQNNTVYSYHKVTYKNVYPHIDWVIYIESGVGSESTLKYDFVVHPGGKVSDIKLQFKGASELGLKADGSLQAATPKGYIREHAPYSYIASASSETAAVEVASRFELNNDILSFKTTPYQGTLVIDPVLEWATYYGGDMYDGATYTVVDSLGNVYIIGHATSASNIATTGAHQTTFGGGLFRPDAYIAKFTQNGVRIWATYYGGDNTDYGNGAALDRAGNIYMSGYTRSTSAIATVGSHQSVFGGGIFDGFLVKFDASGQRLWGTYYGGANEDRATEIAIDGDGHIYMTGTTESTSNIATAGSFQPTNNGLSDAFLVKFDSSGQRIWGTYFGKEAFDWGNAVACDPSNNIYLGGYTLSDSGIATANSHQRVHGGVGGHDAFLAKFNPSGAQEWATYYGGPEFDQISSVATDAAGYVYAVGNTRSDSGIATAGSHQSTHGYDSLDAVDAFLVKFNGAGERQWGTYYGGTGDDQGNSIAIDEQFNLFFTGHTKSPNNIATAGSLQPALNGSSSYDAFIAKFDSAGQREWGSYLGGPGEDVGHSISVDNWGNTYVAGHTVGGFPVTPGSHQDTFLAAVYTSFLVKLCGAGLPQGIINGMDSLCPGSSAIYSVPPVPYATYIWTLPDGSSGSSDSSSILVHMGNNTGILSIQMITCNDTSNIITKEITLFTPVEAIITVDEFDLSTLNIHDTYQWLLSDVPITGATNRDYSVLENGDYKVATMNDGCVDTSDVYTVTNHPGTGIQDQQFLARQISVYPNPAQNELHITSPLPVSLTLTSIEGRTLIYKEAAKKLSLKGLSEGIYLLRINDLDGRLIKTEKIIKR